MVKEFGLFERLRDFLKLPATLRIVYALWVEGAWKGEVAGFLSFDGKVNRSNIMKVLSRLVAAWNRDYTDLDTAFLWKPEKNIF